MSHTSNNKPRRRHHPSSLNPWEALFSSVTRPRKEEEDVAKLVTTTTDANECSSCCQTENADTTNANNDKLVAAAAAATGGGYTILIQHSMTSSSQRQWAALASTSIDNSGRQTRASVAAAAPWNDSMSGPMVVQQAFEELCHRCNGAVVFVSLLGGNCFVDLEELEINNKDYGCGDDDGDEGDTEDGDNNIYQLMNNLQFSSSSRRSSSQRKKDNTSFLRTFRKNGAWVDLSSNAFGWDGEDTDTDNAYNSNINDDDAASTSNSFVHQSTILKLQSIVGTIRKAVASIENRRRSHQNTPTATTLLQQQQRPIPIVFDTLTPLLHFHSVEKIIVMLKCLKRRAALSSPPSIEAGTPSPPPAASTSSSCPPILSPIVAPVLYESLRPSEHRCLEDAADAMIHLKLLDISEYLASTATKMTLTPTLLADQYTTTSATPTTTPTAVISGVLDLVRRGGGGGTGGKLIRHCVPVRIMRSSSLNTTTNIKQPLKVHWNWEILDHHDGSLETEDVTVDKEGIILQQQETKKLSTHADQHASTTTSRPQIYLQDDDPDNNFYDEEADYDYG